MCALEAEVREVKATMGLVESASGDIGQVVPSAKTEGLGSEPPTPTQATIDLPKPIKVEEDDPLTYLIDLFDRNTLDDYEDSDDSSECDSEDDESAVPLSPRTKGFENKYCFYASGRLHYFDENGRIYSEDGTLVYQVSSDFQEDLLTPSFYIAGVPYWFDQEGLLSQDIDNTFIRVHMWLSGPCVTGAAAAEPDLLNLDDFLSPALLPQFEVTGFDPSPEPGPFDGAQPFSTAPPACEGYLTPKTKTEALSPRANSSSVQPTLIRGSKSLLWSPTSSTQESAIVPTGSRESSTGPSLFPESHLGPVSSIPIVTKWKEELVQAQKDAERARPVKKPGKEERRRCPECNKIFRRPSSLDDHLNVHTGKKPHICPFTGCKTGFATKSNMKRHFVTHRVGPLERYRPGITPQTSEPIQDKPSKTGKAPRAPTATYNSNAYHNGRFRIST